MCTQSKITRGDPLSSFAVEVGKGCIFSRFGGPCGAIRTLRVRGLSGRDGGSAYSFNFRIVSECFGKV